MIKEYYKEISTILVLAVIFGVFFVVPALAADSAQITNSASASSNTGGMDGADGKDGEDGKDGMDGEDGAPGQSSAGDSSASAYIKTTINGEDVVNIEVGETATGGGTTTAKAYASTSASGGVVETELPSEVDLASTSMSELQSILSTIRDLLLYYAAKLF